MIRISITFVLLVMAGCAVAQVSQPARYEIVEKFAANSYVIVSMKENGLALVQDKDKIKDRKNLWQLILLDSSLQETYKKELALDPKLKIAGYDYWGNDLYLLFREGETNYHNLVILKIDITTHQETTYTANQQIDFKLSHFSVLDSAAVFGGYIGSEPAVLLYDLPKNNLIILPGFFYSDTELFDLRVNKNNTFNVLLMDRGSKEKKKLILRTFDREGTLLLEDIIDVPSDKTIISAITSVLDRDELIVLGGWGTDKSRQASGVFSVLIDPYKAQPIQFYGFGEMLHTFDFMSTKRAEKQKAKEISNLKNEKSPNFKSPLHPIKIEETEQGFFFLAEMYSPFSVSRSNWNSYNPYPTSSPYAYAPYGFNPAMNRYYNSPVPSYNNRQGGEQVLHSIVLDFDHHGRLRKDFGLPLDNMKLMSLEQVSDFVTIPTGIGHVYKKQSDLIFNITEGNDVVSQDTVKVQLKNSTEKVKYESEDDGGVRSWYKNMLYTWGFATIKNQEKSSEPSRNVFYINKIRVE